ncbi:MAG TPA: TonB-dependent receptor [Gemmatimonadaceae bacterium]|nr:TonB-dependent receptor [Gemmatimonadaceae bacterium]
MEILSMHERLRSLFVTVTSGGGSARQMMVSGAALMLFSSVSAAQVISGKITDAESGQPLSGARVSTGTGAQGAIARADGTYRLPASAGTHVIRVSYIGYSPIIDTVVVTGEGASRDYRMTKGGVTLDATVVTGTRADSRTVLNAPVPVDVLTSAEIKQTGAVETSQILQLLAPSFNFPRPTIADGTDHIRPSTLRGLGPDQVLVLVNGKRRHTSALVNVNGTIGRGSTGVDLNAIPASSIDRIEILRDGAAAQYGSDAIAGVINVILKSDATTDLGVQIGSSYTTLDSLPSKYGDRLTDGDVATVDASTGMNFRGGGFLHITGQYANRGSTNRSLPDRRANPYLPASDPRNQDPELNSRLVFRQGDPHVNDIGFVLNGELPTFANGSQVYGFGGASHREGQGAGNWRQPKNVNNVRSIYPDGFLPLINSTIDDYSGTLGIRGELANWKYDLSGVYGHNSFDFDITNTVNPTLGAASPREFYAGKLKFGQAIANLDFVRAFPLSAFASPLSVGVGGEFRRESYGIGAGEPNSYLDGGVKVLDDNATSPRGSQPVPGSQVFAGFRPSDAGDHNRTNVAGYVDLEANILKNLLLGIAGRAENYSDFGSTTTGKASARYEFYPGYALRGAVATGFRAPSLGQSFFSATATNLLNNVLVENRTFPVESDVAKALGATPLKAEKSVNASLGLAVSPVSNLSFTADYYHITIDDRIVLSGNFVNLGPFLASKGFTGITAARFFTNAIDTRTAGVDIVARYAADFGAYGVSRFTGGYNHTKTRVTRIAATPPPLAAQQAVLFDRVERGRLEVGQPHDNISLTLDHTLKRFDAALHLNKFGEVQFRQSITDPSLDETFGAKWITDVNVSYRVLRQLRLTVGSNNLFDIYPDRQVKAGGANNSGIFPYNGISPFGFNGRFIYAKARYTLDR